MTYLCGSIFTNTISPVTITSIRFIAPETHGQIMEMEMRASVDLRQGEDLMPPLFPLTSSLYTSILGTHYYSCFSPLLCCSRSNSTRTSPSPLLQPLRCPPPPLHSLLPFFLYMSQSSHFFGLLTNRDKLLSSSDSDIVSYILKRAREVAILRGNSSNDIILEEAVFVFGDDERRQVAGYLGITVYDKDFSWINHRCSLNSREDQFERERKEEDSRKKIRREEEGKVVGRGLKQSFYIILDLQGM